MKTTNFEISKKLKEAGFDAQSSFFWCELGKDLIKIHISQSHSVPESIDKIKAYDLETILDALPDSITREYKSNKDGTIKKFEEKLLINKSYIWYRCYDIGTTDEANEYWLEYRYEQNISIYNCDDSLANIAGKMLIKLFEAGLIKFNK